MCSPSKVKRQDKTNEKDRWLTDTGVDIASNKSTCGSDHNRHHVRGAPGFDSGLSSSRKAYPAAEKAIAESFDGKVAAKGSDTKAEHFALERYLKTLEPHEQLALGKERSRNE